MDIDFEAELPGKRLTIVNNDAGNEDAGCQQTTEQTSRSTSTFNIVSENDVEEFNFQHTNRKTLTETVSDLKILRGFSNQLEINEARLIHEIPVSELSSLLCRFLVSLKKKNGEDYESSCLRSIICSFDREFRP